MRSPARLAFIAVPCLLLGIVGCSVRPTTNTGEAEGTPDDGSGAQLPAPSTADEPATGATEGNETDAKTPIENSKPGDAKPGTEKPGTETPGAGTLKRVFVTQKSYSGNLKGLGDAADGFAGADKLCTAEAAAAKLGGQWKAFLSGTNAGKKINAVDRIADVGSFFLVDGKTKAFENKNSLKADALVKVDMFPDGKRFTSITPAWTGTRAGVANGPSCEKGNASWSTDDDDEEGTSGQPLDLRRWADNRSPRDCDKAAPLYCFEQ